MSPLFVAVKDDWLSEAQCHRGFSILSIALPLTCAVHEHLGVLDHETLDKALVLVSTRGG